MAKIKSIHRRQITNQRLYNLAVEGDESYIANGIVVHNCKSYLVPILTARKTPAKIDDRGLKPSDPKLEKFITLKE